jgi:catechol 2,3-dioxygenase-like lactoylglutathione lyase family enzyme
VQLVEVVLYVRDMQRAIRFYRETLGLELTFESEHWTTFSTGDCTLALHATDRREPGTGEPDPTFLVPDAGAERARLAAAGVDTTEIREPVAGTRVFDARDPDGNRFSIESKAWPAGARRAANESSRACRPASGERVRGCPRCGAGCSRATRVRAGSPAGSCREFRRSRRPANR